MAMDAGWDEELLRVEIESLQGSDFDVSLTGFDETEIAELFADDNDDVKDDDFDVEAELEKPCITKQGDIWILGRHKVICGDSTEPSTFEKLLSDTKVNLVCTDAPYFVALKNKSGTIANDNLDDKQAYEFLMKVFTNFKNAMALDASIYEFYATMKTYNLNENTWNEWKHLSKRIPSNTITNDMIIDETISYRKLVDHR